MIIWMMVTKHNGSNADSELITMFSFIASIAKTIFYHIF